MEIDPQTVKQTAPGLLGALGAVGLMSGSWAFRLGMILPGAAGAFFAAGYVASHTGLTEGLAGFLTGLLGMVIVAKLVKTWNDLDLGTIAKKWLHKRFGVEGEQ